MATLEQIIDEARALSPAEKLKLRQALDHELEQAMPAQSRAMESTWVERHRDKYLGQWVALEGARSSRMVVTRAKSIWPPAKRESLALTSFTSRPSRTPM